ncbi:DUF1801 domain-containing protein [Christiangramia sp. SM2212]|uniref:DUF1801 domain-containing protein n=1 Tax=Christiangramia sediminicola TaxID=3073267 RepID=A0ABU1EQS5_9FLAO|nr:DUF1801 domain-containing protein [Christiangramia sp. SM2212]MDR5590746.1 DUF1801 domain-containing protein [Christiangramia sp. SM2212]
MKIEANSPDDYMKKVPQERITAMTKLRQAIKENLPQGFEETINYGMIGFVIPHNIYPSGYHCDPSLPLPFINLASQKNYIAVYHMGIYSDKNIQEWFVGEFKNRTGKKPDMGKSCIRLNNLENIPYDLIGELSSKISVSEWIATYEKSIKRI